MYAEATLVEVFSIIMPSFISKWENGPPKPFKNASVFSI
jgi:hypothetical protein